MDVPVRIRLGLNGADTQLGRIRLNRRLIDTASQHFGAYHILEMGRHFDDYLIAWPPPQLQMYYGPHLALRRTGKQRAPVITGNIGETVAGQVFRRKIGVPISRLRHIYPTSRFRTPDYLLDCRVAIPPRIIACLNNPANAPFTRWPVESKAAATAGRITQSVRSALQQVASYWFNHRVTNAAVMGYGIIVTFQYQGQSPEVVVRIFEPSHQAILLQSAGTMTAAQFTAAINRIGSAERGALRNVN